LKSQVLLTIILNFCYFGHLPLLLRLINLYIPIIHVSITCIHF